ncbi:MAG: glutamine synthetase family protein [Rhizobiaceae bacterium]
MSNEMELFLNANPDITHVDAMMFDLCGKAYGKRLPRAHAGKLASQGSPVCAAMSLVDVTGNTADPMGYGFSDGDPDAMVHPVAGRIARVPWVKGLAQALCEPRHPDTGDHYWFDPRKILRQTVDRLAGDGLKPVVACELEFYLISREREENGRPLPAMSPGSGRAETAGEVLSLSKLDEFQPVISAIEAACAVQNIPCSTVISEYGAGQFEVNLEHRDDPVAAADDALLLRRIIGAVARQFSMDATFMSKPFPEQAGSGFHVHASLSDGAGGNRFDPAVNPQADTLLGYAAAGLMATLGEGMAIFAPNPNVYRRFEANNFTPVTLDWGYNNRSVAFRVPASPPASRRLEHRASGAEANPYLVMAAVLAGMHHGIVEKLDPGAMATGNAGEERNEALPFTLPDALRALRAAKILPQWLGKDYPEIYATVKEAELAAFAATISRQEYEWYL